jgi:hypothetical protein
MIKNDWATGQTPDLEYLDRYRNEGTRTYSSHAAYSAAQEQYRPNADYGRFALDAFELPRQRMLVYSANPRQDLEARYVGAETVLFCVHPQTLELGPDDPYVHRTMELSMGRQEILVTPSSSTRTLYVQDSDYPHALKVHFPFKISRYTRKMRKEVIEQAVNVSRELEAGIGQLGGDFAFLREVLGVVHPNLDAGADRGENWGYLVRDMAPFPNQERESFLIPGFALYGRDYFVPQAPLLLFDLIGDHDPVQYVLDNIMLPIVSHWTGCFKHFGFMLEPHGQNVLLEMDVDHTVRRIIHRDLSVGIDMRRRHDLGLPDDELNNYNRTEEAAFHSVTYDRFMGGHFFNRLVAVCQERYPGVHKEMFTRPCRELFTECLPEYGEYFPQTVWYFSEKRDRFNKPYHVDTGVEPEWRP